MSRNGIARSSSADADHRRPRSCTERTSTAISLGRHAACAIRRSTSAATACACARSERQRQKRTLPPPRAARASSARRLGAARPPRAAAVEDAPAASGSCARADHARRPGTRARSRRGSSRHAPRKRWIAWSSSPATVTLRCSCAEQPQQQRPAAKFSVLELVDQHVPEARGHALAHVRLLVQQPERVQRSGRRSRARRARASRRSWSAYTRANSSSRPACARSASRARRAAARSA